MAQATAPILDSTRKRSQARQSSRVAVSAARRYLSRIEDDSIVEIGFKVQICNES